MLKLVDLARRSDFRAGPLDISPSRRLIEGPAGRTSVEPIVMKVFLLLLEARGNVVTRDELFGMAWGGVFVGDDSLNRAIARVRKIAAETAPGIFEIETIPRTGYRLTGPILGELDNSEGTTTATRVARRKLLAAGGAALAVGAGATLWTVGRSRAAPDPRAQQLVDRADWILRSDIYYGDKQALRLLRQAVAIDTGNARAWGLLSYALATGSDDDGNTQSPERLSEIDSAIGRALALDERESNALLTRYLVQGSMRDWIRTDTNLRQIIGIDPRNTYAIVRLVALLQAVGLNKESWDWNERQIAIDPLSPGPQFRRAMKFWIFGRIAEADVAADQVMLHWPKHPNVWNARFIIYAFTGRAKAALAMLDDAEHRPTTLAPLALKTWRTSLEALDVRTPAAIAAAREANLAGARQLPVLAAYGVMILGALGEIDSAFEIANGFLLGRGPITPPRPTADGNFTTSVGWRLTQWLFTPPVAPLRSDPRFIALADGIGLTSYWRTRRVQPDYLLRRG